MLDTWESARPLTDDLEAVRWARSRGLDAGDLEDRDLARVIPAGARLPAFAIFRGRSWAETHRLIVRKHGPTGKIESLHARALRPDVDVKSVSPAGFEVRGLVMADSLGRMLLERGHVHGVAEPTLVIAEGVPDYLTLATTWSDADEDAPAVMGILSGSWTPELAARVPDGAVVVIATDPDGAGDAYAATIVATFADRMRAGRVRVKRWRSQPGATAHEA